MARRNYRTQSSIGFSFWKEQPLGVSILRLWLGFTWIYAGWNKATDAGFLNKASAQYIGRQLSGFLGQTPIDFAVRKMVEHAQIMGWMVMLSEFAIGIALLSGIALDLAIIGGASISLILLLTATWNVSPYFLGSDSAYLVMWIALFFLIRKQPKRSKNIAGILPNVKDRREVVRLLGVASAAVIAALAGGSRQPKVGAINKEIARVADFPVGTVKQFTALDGNPAILFRTNAGVFAYSAICTHQGCTVSYDSLGHTLNCPCHGGKFDVNNGGKVIAGPPPLPIPKINVAIAGDSIVQI